MLSFDGTSFATAVHPLSLIKTWFNSSPQPKAKGYPDRLEIWMTYFVALYFVLQAKNVSTVFIGYLPSSPYPAGLPITIMSFVEYQSLMNALPL
jgi:hypothetical protein